MAIKFQIKDGLWKGQVVFLQIVVLMMMIIIIIIVENNHERVDK